VQKNKQGRGYKEENISLRLDSKVKAPKGTTFVIK
jgi:hypothetical protein